MSVREEDKDKNCSSRGLGIAAAAIGVGVGAALYYFFNKRSENPADAGATTSGWNCEEPHVLDDHESSFITISEHSTTDTSIHDTSSDYETEQLSRLQAISKRLWHDSTDSSDLDSSISEYSISSDNSSDVQLIDSMTEHTVDSESDVDSDTAGDWDVTRSSLDMPRVELVPRSPIMMQFGELTVRLLNPQDPRWKSPWKIFPKYFRSAAEREKIMREQAFRDRTWTLEECSICFEVMLKEQEVLVLSCTHRFHQACIMPWLQEQQTCPMCRKAS